MGSLESPAAMLVTDEIPKTYMPICAATMASGTVLAPTKSARSVLSI